MMKAGASGADVVVLAWPSLNEPGEASSGEFQDDVAGFEIT